MTIKFVKCYVTDWGDASVGIFPVSWELECPFTTNGCDEEGYEFFRGKIRELYSEFSDGKIEVSFDFEKNYADI